MNLNVMGIIIPSRLLLGDFKSMLACFDEELCAMKVNQDCYTKAGMS